MISVSFAVSMYVRLLLQSFTVSQALAENFLLGIFQSAQLSLSSMTQLSSFGTAPHALWGQTFGRGPVWKPCNLSLPTAEKGPGEERSDWLENEVCPWMELILITPTGADFQPSFAP